jgi:hypothetical protein
MGVSSAPVRLLENLAPIEVTCSKQAIRSCRGTVTVQGTSRSLSIAGGPPAAKLIRFGSEEYAIPRGATEKVLVPLSRRAIRAIRRSGALQVTVLVTARDASGKRAKPIAKKLWLKPATKRKAKRARR